jgi:hypothetical protein
MHINVSILDWGLKTNEVVIWYTFREVYIKIRIHYFIELTLNL